MQSLDNDGSLRQRFNYLHFWGFPVTLKYLLTPGQEVSVGGFSLELLDEQKGENDTRSAKANFGLKCRPAEKTRLRCNLDAKASAVGVPDARALDVPGRTTGIIELEIAAGREASSKKS